MFVPCFAVYLGSCVCSMFAMYLSFCVCSMFCYVFVILCLFHVLLCIWDSVVVPCFVMHLGFCVCSMFCCALLCVLYSFAIILFGKRELVSLFCLSSWCLVIVVLNL